MNFCRKVSFFGLFCIFMFLFFPNLSVADEVLPTNFHTESAEVINGNAPADIGTIEKSDVKVSTEATEVNEETTNKDQVIQEENSKNEEEASSQVPVFNKESSSPIQGANPSNVDSLLKAPQFLSTDRYFEAVEQFVPIYDNSGGSLKQVGYLIKGQVYPRLSDYGDWHQIKFGNGYGYVWEASTKPVMASSIKSLNTNLKNFDLSFKANLNLPVYDNSTGSLIQFATILKDTHYPVLSDLGDWYQIDVSGRIGYVYKAATTRPFFATDRYFEVIENQLPIYDNSSGSLKHVGYLNKGEVYPRVADYGDWHQIKFGNEYGYVWEAGTKPATASSIKNSNINLQTTALSFMANINLPVYDNSSGSLIQFATILKDNQYPVISDFGDWYQIDVSGRIGYVYKAATTRPFFATDHYFEVIETQLPIYDNSSGSLKQVGYLNKGEVYSRITDYGDWHQIKFGSGYGYVWEAGTKPATASQIKNANVNLQNTTLSFKANINLPVYDNSTGRLIPFATILKDTQYHVISDLGDWYQIDLSGRIGYVYKAATTRSFISSDRYFEVTETQLPIYENSSGTLKHVGYLNKGEVYPRLADFGDWHQIKFGNRYGYVWKAGTKVPTAVSIINLNTGLKNSGLFFKPNINLPVYDNSTGSLVPFASILKDSKYPVIGDYGDWYKIDVSGRVGFVYKGGVETIAEPSIYGKVIVLDAGHGGSDSGAVGRNNYEKTLTLQTANKLAAMLREAGATVILTRESDFYLTLAQRVEISRQYKPDAFISVHYNSFSNPSTSGIETYYYSVTKDRLLADVVHQSIMEQVSLKDRGVRFGDFHVLRENPYTAILLELGYISNLEEEKIIASNEYQNIVVKGIFNGLKNYFQ